MKVIYVLLALLLVSCQTPVDNPQEPVNPEYIESHVLIRMDSFWNETRIPFTVAHLGRRCTPLSRKPLS